MKTHSPCWTAAEWNDVSGRHPTHEMRLSPARVCLWICKCCSHYVMQASQPQQERLWHVCFQQQISEGWKSYGDLPTADVNNVAKSTERWPHTRSRCDPRRFVMDITETHLPRFLQIYVMGMRDGPRLIGSRNTAENETSPLWCVLSKRSKIWWSQVITKIAFVLYFLIYRFHFKCLGGFICIQRQSTVFKTSSKNLIFYSPKESHTGMEWHVGD